jgi:hypothetical protein
MSISSLIRMRSPPQERRDPSRPVVADARASARSPRREQRRREPVEMLVPMN